MSNFNISPRLAATFRNRTARFRWGGGDVDYAHKVHRTRPWTQVGLRTFPVEEAIAQSFEGNQELDTAFAQTMMQLGDHFTAVIDNYDWGRSGKGQKRFRNGRGPTYRQITDSGALANSGQLLID